MIVLSLDCLILCRCQSRRYFGLVWTSAVKYVIIIMIKVDDIDDGSIR